ncbi:TetR/AcrR family transcriptional regulator [Sphingomonas sp. DOAB1063]|uniref:TetR/AcrR family transcriptional regulator n=2 Tax=Sphingomonas albertensis TaxID=2762591 RepID=A0ABR7ARR1_9SPHN|nr:TetR/AcrR family transcriptional regulator [Sphingomonas albertensis]
MSAVQHEKCSRERIIAAARHLFATQGFHQTPMSELAQAAEVSVGQIYRLFTGKNAVIQAIVMEDATGKMAEMQTMNDSVKSCGMSIEEGFVELSRRALSKGDEALTFEIMAEAHRNTDVADTIADLCSGFRSMIRDLACVANPDLSDNDLEGAEELILAFMFGLGHRTLSRPRLSEDETARLTGRMILAAVRAL